MTFRPKLAVLLATILLSACVATGWTQPTESDRAGEMTQIMIVPTYHLANNNRDLINLPVEDVLTPERQQELEQLVENLARWKPTKIVLEWEADEQEDLDREYQSYLDGDLAPSANERNQIGMRLARKLGHHRVYAADWNGSFPGDWSNYDFIAWAEEHGEGPRFADFISQGQARLDRQAERMRSQSIIDWYFDLADPALRAEEHAVYFDIASFGDTENNPGAAWVGGWYGRNLRIFDNIRDLSEPGDRILVLYGLGHTFLLERFWIESSSAELVDARPYIKP